MFPYSDDMVLLVLYDPLSSNAMIRISVTFQWSGTSIKLTNHNNILRGCPLLLSVTSIGPLLLSQHGGGSGGAAVVWWRW
jgi:hypothetical protein